MDWAIANGHEALAETTARYLRRNLNEVLRADFEIFFKQKIPMIYVFQVKTSDGRTYPIGEDAEQTCEAKLKKLRA